MLEPPISDEVFALFVSQIRDRAVISLAPDGTVLSWNAGAAALKGYDADAIVGRNFRVFYTQQDRAAGLPDTLLAIAEREGSTTHVGHRVRADGSLFWGEVNLSSVRGDDGELLGFVKVTRDASERRDSILQSRARLQEVVHDVRTPLSAALGLLELASEDPASVDSTDLIVRAMRRLHHAVDLLQPLGSRLSANDDGVRIDGEQVDIADVARAVVVDLSPIMNVTRVRVAASGVTAPVARADVDRILTNLVVNALKHSGSGSVVVDVSVLDGRARLTVSDSGHGIHPDDLAHVFEAGYRGRAVTSDGSGLGLASVQDTATRFGGSVSIESIVGTGTVVTVNFPADPRTAATPIAA